jgi:hypothetical protein
MAALLYNDLSQTAAVVNSSATIYGLGWDRLTDVQPRHRARVNATSAILILDLGARTLIDVAALISTVLDTTATVRLRMSTNDAHGLTNLLFDSGVLSDVTAASWNGNVVFCLSNLDGSSASVNVRYVRWDVTVPVAPIDIGLAPVGLLWRPTYNFSYGAQEGRDDLSVRDVNPDTGSEFAVQRPQKRTRVISFDGLTKTEVRGSLDALDRAVGASRDLLYVEDPTAANLDLAQNAIWGGFWVPNTDNFSTRKYSNVFSRPMRLVERL